MANGHDVVVTRCKAACSRLETLGLSKENPEKISVCPPQCCPQ